MQIIIVFMALRIGRGPFMISTFEPKSEHDVVFRNGVNTRSYDPPKKRLHHMWPA
jgi:hypothetical protein